MIQTLQLILSLSILVVLHEFGHYITARFFGCRVEKFYLFMDWNFALFKKKIGETEFGIGWLPLGGYVKIAGFIDESMDDEGLESPPQPWELRSKPAWQRLIVMLGGIVVNILLAWFIYSALLFSWGEKYTPIDSFKYGFSFNEGGEKLGFVDGDQILSIDGLDLKEYNPMLILSAILFEGAQEVTVFRDGGPNSIKLDPEDINTVINSIQNYEGNILDPRIPWIVDSFMPNSIGKQSGLIKGDRIFAINDFQTPFISNEALVYLKSQAGKTITLKIKRGNDWTEELSVDLGDDGLIGVTHLVSEYERLKSYSFLASIPAGLVKTKNMVKMYWGQVKTIFNPKTGGYKHVGGVISIGKMFPSNWDWFSFWSMTALLSVILAIMNLLPIPALDGGHALIAVGEMITGKKLPIKVLMPLQIVGMIMLFALLIYANGMDIIRLFN